MTGGAAWAADDGAEAIEYLRTGQAGHTYRVQAEAIDECAASGERLRAVKTNPPFYRLRVEFRSGKALRQEHRAAAARALPYSARTRFGVDITETARRCHDQ